MVIQMSATPLRMQYCLDGLGYFQRFLFGVLHYDRTTALMDRDIFRRFCLVSSTTIGLIPRTRVPVLKIIQPLNIAITIVRKWPHRCVGGRSRTIVSWTLTRSHLLPGPRGPQSKQRAMMTLWISRGQFGPNSSYSIWVFPFPQ